MFNAPEGVGDDDGRAAGCDGQPFAGPIALWSWSVVALGR